MSFNVPDHAAGKLPRYRSRCKSASRRSDMLPSWRIADATTWRSASRCRGGAGLVQPAAPVRSRCERGARWLGRQLVAEALRGPASAVGEPTGPADCAAAGR